MSRKHHLNRARQNRRLARVNYQRPRFLSEQLEQRLLLASDPLFRINAGGPELVASPLWTEDTAINPAPYVNAATGNSQAANTGQTIDLSNSSLPAGTPLELFQTNRWDKSGNSEMQWDFTVAPGEYEVRLYFAETWSGGQAAGVRMFDVAIEGVTVLDDYDIYADVGGYTGVMKSFNVTSDGNLDIDFGHVTQNPQINGIEILDTSTGQTDTLSASATTLDFGTVLVNESASRTLTLTNTGQAGDNDLTIDPSAASSTPGGSPYSTTFASTQPIVLAPGQSTAVTVTYAPTNEATHNATLTIPHSGNNTPIEVTLAGTATSNIPISFTKSVLANAPMDRPTKVQLGPDGRMYVAQQNGLIRMFDVVRNGPNDYEVVGEEQLSIIQNIPNHDDDGTLNTSVTKRQVTGMLVTGTAQNPVLYVSSSDPRIGEGNPRPDTNLDTNSGIVSRVTWNGSSWEKLDLVRGLPRSEGNHSVNGLDLDEATNTLYLAIGGNTNAGATSNGFAFLPEYALSAAVLSIDLDAIGETTYDLPTLDDEDRAGTNDFNDPFGGNDGKNQAILVPGGPVQVYGAGFRNPYDVVVTTSGRIYSFDNGPNAGWGDIPINEGPEGNATNEPNEPGISYVDQLHYIDGPNFYGGHPNPTRSNPNNTFNDTNPQSPVALVGPAPIESDFLEPGVEDGALFTVNASTNGLDEYTTNHFGGQMQGDLIIASFDNTVKRVKLNETGDAAVIAETLFNNVGIRPLDVDVIDSGDWAGTILVADIGFDEIYIYEPATGGSSDPNDLDGDGYTNDDEIANGTDPNSAADVPPDYDQDFVSNLNDPDDDNDSQLDTSDPFAIDPANGQNTPLNTFYTWDNDAPNPGGLLNLGFTGVMTNGIDDYESLFDEGAVTAGGAAGLFTLDSATAGTARGATNTQEQAMQFGIDVSNATTPFSVQTSVVSPFGGRTPQAGQQMGLFIGTGDQDNYVEIVLAGDNGGEVQLLSEFAGSDTVEATQAMPLPGADFVNLYLTIDPVANLLQASFAADGGSEIDLGSPITLPAAWLTSSLAVGVIATDPTSSGNLPATWEFLGVVPETSNPGGAQANVIVNAGGALDGSSTFASGSFQITNQSTNGQTIESIQFDLRSAFLPDVVFDPLGGAGDVGAVKGFTPDSGQTETNQLAHAFSGDHDGGFDILDVTFGNFDPGETFTFSADIDPTSIQGVSAPGPAKAGSISGLELTGSTVTITFSDGSIETRELFAINGSKTGSQVTVAEAAPAAPTLELVGVAGTPTQLTDPNQTARITGPQGATVRLLQVEGALHLDGVPNGGFDLDPFEANSAVAVTHHTATIGAGGTVDIPVTLTDSHADGGLNHFMAIVQASNGTTSGLSSVLVVELVEPTGGGGNSIYRVNAGGPEVAGSPTWTVDTNATSSPYVNATTGNSRATSFSDVINLSHASIPTGTPMEIFQSERWDKPGSSEMEWDFAVTPGEHEVRLYFAETWSGAQSSGARVFDVAIEGVTVLDNYDIYADVGGYAGVMKSFIVTTDANLDIDFSHVVQNPAIKAIEIVSSTTGEDNLLVASATSFDFGSVLVNESSSQTLTLTNDGQPGDSDITLDPAQHTMAPSGSPFTATFASSQPIVLSPGEATNVTITYAPTAENTHNATLTIPHSGNNTPISVALSGVGASSLPISFTKSTLANAPMDRPTKLQFGPDGRLYVAQQNGLIRIFDVVQNGSNDYEVVGEEQLTIIQDIPNHDDDGSLNPSVDKRLITGMLVTGTAQNPVLYVTSSDPRIGAGVSGVDLNLDTNSGTVSRVTWNGSSWEKLDLVRGLPRSEENHGTNGLALDTATNTLYFGIGGNTNMGAPSNNFALLPEYALSAAILSVDLDAIGETTYDLPTLDDEDRSGSNDLNDPFGGNDGKNQAIIDPNGPVQVYAPGFRNPYDLIITTQGRMYTVDNGPNAGWGDVPIGEGPGGNATNQVHEPGTTYGDGLHYVSGPGYYGGHPNPTRSNPNNTFNNSNPQSPVALVGASPIESDFQAPGIDDPSLAQYTNSTNGIDEYTTNNFGAQMQGDLIIASFDNTVKRVKFNSAGDTVVVNQNLFNNVGIRPLDVEVVDGGAWAGSIWVADIGTDEIYVYEPSSAGSGDPNDFDGDGYTNDDEIANGTNPNSAADVPPDYDQDFVSNLTDPDDDNDSQLDNVDPFAIDATNGQSTPIGTVYTWENNAPNPGGLLDLGFTGVMTNGSDDYESLFDPTAITAGGAAGVFTIDSATIGTARGATNTQEQALQFGVDVSNATEPFAATTSVLGPFSGQTPQPGQEMGLFIGTGDQDNYVQIVLSGDSGGQVQVVSEFAGIDTLEASQTLALPGPSFVDLYLAIDPVTNLLQASYDIDGGTRVDVGGPIAIPAAWLTGSLAVGVISTDPTGSGAMPITWDFLGVVPVNGSTPPPGEVVYRVNAGGESLTASPSWEQDGKSTPSPYSNVASSKSLGTDNKGGTYDLSDPSLPAGTPMELFQSQRWDRPTGGPMEWDFPVAPGDYEVRLYFSEIVSGNESIGARVFDVAIEGQIVLNDFDIFAEAGPDAGIMRSFHVTSDANLEIDFSNVVNNPAISAIEILTAPAETASLATASFSDSLEEAMFPFQSGILTQMADTNLSDTKLSDMKLSDINSVVEHVNSIGLNSDRLDAVKAAATRFFRQFPLSQAVRDRAFEILADREVTREELQEAVDFVKQHDLLPRIRQIAFGLYQRLHGV